MRPLLRLFVIGEIVIFLAVFFRLINHLALACWLLLSLPVAAYQLQFSVEDLTHPEFSLENISIQLNQDGSAELSIQKAKLIALEDRWTNIHLLCPQWQYQVQKASCTKGTLSFISQRFGRQKTVLNADIDLQQNTHQLAIEKLSLFGGIVNLSARKKADTEKVQLRMANIRLDHPQLKKLTGLQLALAGKTTAVLNVAFSEKGKLKGQLTFKLKQLNYQSDDESIIADSVNAKSSIRFWGDSRHLAGDFSLNSSSAEFLTPAFYLSAQEDRLDIKGQFDYIYDKQHLRLKRTTVQQGSWLHLTLDSLLAFNKGKVLRSLSLNTGQFPLKTIYENYLQPVLPDAAYQLGGDASLKLELNNGQQYFDLTTRNASVQLLLDEVPMWSLNGINTRISKQLHKTNNRISWASAELYGKIPIAKGHFDFTLENDELLADEWHIPIFDGALILDTIQLKDIFSGQVDLNLNAVITPISLEEISAAFDWPLLEGTLAGVIPGVAFHKQQLDVEGRWLVQMFDGKLLLDHLSITDPFGSYPLMQANIKLDGLDLEKTTNTFAFGKITGTFDGRIDQLKMENWHAVAFDAYFSTRKDDDKKHRISQRAVDNIADLGGAGVAGALSRSFMRFIEEFSYDQLGIGCKLDNGICQMTGVENSDQGYYLVKGGGIPRIDIMGFNRHADWELLLQKLVEITQTGAPIIE